MGKIRVFKKQDGSVIYNHPAPKFQNGELVDDLSRPIYSEIDDLNSPITEEIEDLEQPIFQEIKIETESGDEVIHNQIVGYQRKAVVIGYNKKTVLIGYEKRALTLEDCKIPEDLKDLPFIVLDESEIHPSDSTTGNYHEMIHFDGECKKENLKQDKGWNVRLMPGFLIKQKHLIKLNQKIDQELSKESPDSIKLMKHHREKELCSSFTEKDWAEKALANLDERVAGGEADKPKIRKALKQKIKELQNVKQQSENP